MSSIIFGPYPGSEPERLPESRKIQDALRAALQASLRGEISSAILITLPTSVNPDAGLSRFWEAEGTTSLLLLVGAMEDAKYEMLKKHYELRQQQE